MKENNIILYKSFLIFIHMKKKHSSSKRILELIKINKTFIVFKQLEVIYYRIQNIYEIVIFLEIGIIFCAYI